ncbi:hypothetical protein [Sodalis sp. RH19]|uniref:hypothetical protein n=1 Tax=Sodalis sp. RH19 TaxID=3394334 RepID=UPI0039B637EF
MTLTVKKTLNVGTETDEQLKYEMVSGGTNQGIRATAYREIVLGEARRWHQTPR